MAKKLKLAVLLNDQELNYIDSALRWSAAQHKKEIYEHGETGNIGYLFRYTSRLQRKLEKIHTAWIRKRMGEKKWKEHCKMVRQMIRKAMR